MKKYLVNENILILSPSEWSDNAVSNMHISSRLSLKNNIIYLETIGGRFPKISELGRVFYRLLNFFGLKKENKIQKGLNPNNVKIFSPLVIPIFNTKFFDFINKWFLLFQLNSILKKNDFKNIVIWCFSPRWDLIIYNLKYKHLIFHCVDALHTYDKSSKFKDQFYKILKKSDLVITPGSLLYEELKNIQPKTIRVPHGCDDRYSKEFFNKIELENLQMVKKPRAIYVGTLANWIDYDLLIESVQSNKKVSFIIIGYIHALAPKDKVERLINLMNVFYLGYKKFEELPSYINACDVCLVPYDQNNLHIKYSTPTKFLDYLATGLPIVSTNFIDANNYKKLIYIANNKKQFSNLIKKALSEKSNTLYYERKKYALNNTWSKQIKKMEINISKIIY